MNYAKALQAEPRSQKPTTFTGHIAEELRHYDEHLRDVRGLSAGTREDYKRSVGQLLQQKFSKRGVDIAKLSPEDIRRFLADQFDAHPTMPKASSLASALRSYFRYRTVCGDHVIPLEAVISSPVQWKLAALPRALKADEIERLLASFATVRRWPKRSYAIVRCALDLGLRAGEIAHLMLDDIDWRTGTVTLRGTKSLRQDILPLPIKTGQALADYLQHERPVTSNPTIFIGQTASHDQPISSSAVQKLIARACRRIGLMHSTAHTFRHTLACQLVENGCSLKEVADVLRHRSLNTTMIYAKLDTPKLSTVPLPWPGSPS
jgi:site-specific recombinase XerD